MMHSNSDNKYLGCHLSSSKGYLHMGKEATLIGANTFQFFTRNPRGGKAKEQDEDDVRKYIEYAKGHSFGRIIAHAPYTLNPCSDKERVREFAHIVMTEDIAKLECIPDVLYNFHPGSHVGQGAEKGIEMIAELLNSIITPKQKTMNSWIFTSASHCPCISFFILLQNTYKRIS